MAASKPTDLKRLEFLRSFTGYYVSNASSLADYFYSGAKSYAPTSLEPTIKALEDKAGATFSAYGTPLIAAVQDKSEGVLKSLDETVDGAASFMEKKRWYVEARDSYLGKIHNAATYISQQGISGVTKAAADAVLAKVEEAKKVPNYLSAESKQLLKHVQEAYERLINFPVVASVVQTAQPSVEFAKKKYIAAHDALVASPTYNNMYKTSFDSLNRVQHFQIYKTAADKLYPVVQPYVEPVLEKVQSSDVYVKFTDHFHPQPVAAN